MCWLLEEEPDDGRSPAAVLFDSYSAANVARCFWVARANEELAVMARSLASRVEERRVVTCHHVYGHSGPHENEIADRLADAGARRLLGVGSRRWAAPAEGAAAEDEPMGYCRECGAAVPERSVRWHVRRCTAVGWVIPEGVDKCRKCGGADPGWVPQSA